MNSHRTIPCCQYYKGVHCAVTLEIEFHFLRLLVHTKLKGKGLALPKLYIPISTTKTSIEYCNFLFLGG